jgi:hypothetical protein
MLIERMNFLKSAQETLGNFAKQQQSCAETLK